MSAEIITLPPYRRARLNLKPQEMPYIPPDYKRVDRQECDRCTWFLALVIIGGVHALCWLIELCARLS